MLEEVELYVYDKYIKGMIVERNISAMSVKWSSKEFGFIIAGEDCRTKTDGIFAAGDCRTKAVRQLTTAAADGAVAALGACEFAE